jgi:NADH dehydrogenase (ubiquinone) Fe-S protein 1
MVDLLIDDIPVSVPRNTTILQACDSVGIDVPRFCFHERLLIAGNCRMCLVEVSHFPNKPIASCTFPVGKDMKVYTRTPLVKKAQESVLEFLLLNHPLDCPICDQGGECDLQDQAMLFGSDSGRFYEYKRGVEDKNCGPLVKTIMTRCIHCTRCVRFATEIGGISDLGTTGRGRKTEIGTYVQKLIRSELSGNIIDLCPVGALTSKPYAFTARSWELKSTESIDIFDGLGSNIIVNTKGNEVMRILPKFNENINEEWITDKVRFSYDGLKKQRLSAPYLKSSEGLLKKVTWSNALNVIAEKINQSSQVSIVASDTTDLESLTIAKKFLNTVGSSSIYITNKNNLYSANLDFPSSYSLNAALPDLESHDLCILVNVNPRIEAPLLNSRLRKVATTNKMKVVYVGEKLDLTFPTVNLGFSKKSVIELLEGRHPICSEISNAKSPLFIFGNNMSSFNLNKVSSLLQENINTFAGGNSKCFFHFLNNNISNVGSFDLGVKNLDKDSLVNKKLIFLLGTNQDFDFSILPSDCFVIYIGTHGTLDASLADMILPGLAFTEKRTSYINISGNLQNTYKALFGPGDSRDDWKIFCALLHVLGFNTPFTNLQSLYEFFNVSLYYFNDKRQQSLPFFSKEPLSSNFLENQLFNKGLTNFYLSNTIAKNSRVMAECSISRIKQNYS